MNNTFDHLKWLALSTHFIIVRPTYQNWYELLDVVEEMEDRGFSIYLLDRFPSDVSVIPEKTMNRLGWYRNE